MRYCAAQVLVLQDLAQVLLVLLSCRITLYGPGPVSRVKCRNSMLSAWGQTACCAVAMRTASAACLPAIDRCASVVCFHCTSPADRTVQPGWVSQ